MFLLFLISLGLLKYSIYFFKFVIIFKDFKVKPYKVHFVALLGTFCCITGKGQLSLLILNPEGATNNVCNFIIE